VRGETGNFVAHALGWCNGHFIDDAFIGVEVKCKTSVVLLDDGAGTFLYGLGSDSL